jgi:hypothetical protein
MKKTAANGNGGKRGRRLTGTAAIGKFLKKLPLAAFHANRLSRKPPLTLTVVFLALLGALFLGACANVKPWQREPLSRPGMQVDPEPLVSSCDDHIYFSREASKGGRSYGGGGCGCN